MENITPQQEKKLKKIIALGEKGLPALLEYMFELEEKLDENIPDLKNIMEKVRGKPGKDYVITPSDRAEIASVARSMFKDEELAEKVLSLITIDYKAIAEDASKMIKVPQPEKVDYRKIKADVLADIKVENGAPGKDADETFIIEKLEADLIKDLPSYGEQFRDGLEVLEGDDRLDRKAIKGLEDYEDIRKYARNTTGGVSYTGLTGIQDIIAGTNITIDKSNNKYPVISATGGGGSYTGGTGIDITGTVISLDFSEFDTDDIADTSTNRFVSDAQIAGWNALVSSQWDNVTGGINYAGGRVGIGTTAPDRKVEINLGTSDFLRLTYNDSNGSATVYNDIGIDSSSNLLIRPSGNGQIVIGPGGWAYTTAASGAGSILFNNGTTDSPNMKFAYGANANYSLDVSSSLLRFAINADEAGGAVIGTMNTSGDLIMLRDISATRLLTARASGTFSATSPGIELYASNGYKIGFDNVSGTRGYVRYNVDTAGSSVHGHIFSGGAPGSQTDLMLIRSDGNVGIGTSTPSYRLDVSGPAHFTGDGWFEGDGSMGNAPANVGFYFGKSATDSNRRMEIVTPANGIAYIDFTNPSVDYVGRIRIDTDSSKAMYLEMPGYVYVGGNSSGGILTNTQGLAFGWNRTTGNGDSNIIYNTSLGSDPRLAFGSYNGTTYAEEMSLKGGNLGIGVTSPTAAVHLKAGTATAGTSPLKFATGTLLSTTEAGAVEFASGHLYFTATNSGTRYQLDQQAVGANSTITSLTGLTGAISSPTSITFAGTASPTYAAGKLVYDTGNESLTFYNNDSNVALQVGQEEWIRVVNNTGSTIPNGAVVYLSGASGGKPTIALAQSNAAATTIGAGLATESIANGATGYVTCIGNVNGLDTSAFTAGQTVYISSTVAGGLTATAPTSPNYRYRVGIVGVSSATVGTIHVTPSTAALGNGTANQVFGMNAAGTAQEVKTLASGTNITVAHTTNTATFNLSGVVTGANGGTGVANTGKTITIGGNFVTSGASALTLTTTGTTNATIPSGTTTLANLTSSQAFTNKDVTSATNAFASVVTTASSATPTPTGDSRENELYVTALATNATIGAPTGTPTNGNKLKMRIKDNGTARTLAFNAAFRAIGITLPTTTVISKTMYIGAFWNSTDSVWDVTSYALQA